MEILEVADALVRYINQGITLGSVNLPEAQLRSLTLDEPNHARVRTPQYTLTCEIFHTWRFLGLIFHTI